MSSDYLCRAICLNGKRCTFKWRHENKLCGIHVKMSNIKTVDSDISSICLDCEDECPICYGAIVDPIKCHNGHLICGKHYINDILSMSKLRGDNNIKCFICRQIINSDNFNRQFRDNICNVYLDVSYSNSSPESLSKLKLFLKNSLNDIIKILNFIE